MGKAVLLTRWQTIGLRELITNVTLAKYNQKGQGYVSRIN